jgi:aminoglycoside phosphotransferase (APT) family kinase protein
MAGVCLVPLPPAESGIILRELFEEVAYWSDTLAWVKRDFSMGMEIQDPIRTLSESIPDTQPGLSWGDARFANQIFCNVDCVGLLDWEMASAGGGLLDLAWWLMFDVNHSVDMDLPRLAGLGGVEATVALWQRKTGLSAQHLDWFARFSLVRLAIIRCALYGVRKRMGLPVPNSDDPRSVEKLLARLDKLNYR